MVISRRSVLGTMDTRINRGERHGNHKLGEVEVLEIRRLYEEENVSMTELAGAFDVAVSTISSIVHYRSWKEI